MKLLPQNKYLKALVITLIYVGLGTLSVCSVYPDDTFSGMWALFGLIITLPVSIISFSYRFADAKDIQPIFIIQAIMLIPTYLVVLFILRRKPKSKEVA
jgi:hypothetical protein